MPCLPASPQAEGRQVQNGSRIGAAMVVGGGIAGIQASLDLAEAGFKVYLVETRSAIGGHMAQLDKTFPTNDCAMCTLAPRLVEVGRHLNIEILTNSELIGLDGEAGDFTARVRRRPRYVDLDKCTACGDCAAVCPITLPDPYEEGLVQRKAIDKLYAQAIPNAYAIEKEGVAPCRDACPIGQRAQGYIALIRQRRYQEALRLIQNDNPFPSVCGRTCHHPCEGSCNRARVDEGVGIMALKRFVADYTYAFGRKPVERVPRTRPEWVAVVGSGPAGLTAAQDLVKMGYRVTVFEALSLAGGLMRTGIPAHRLPKGILQRDIDDILALGVELKLNSPIEDPTSLLDEGYDAVFLATGVYEEARLDIEGEDLDGVIQAIDMLREINLGGAVEIGASVVVIGGGIAAVDAAAVCLRTGAKDVYLFLRRPRGEVPAYQWEIDEVEREGARLMEGYTVSRVLGDSDRKVVGVEYAEAELTRARTYKPIAGTEATFDVDTVISAVGRSSNLSFLHEPFQSLRGNPKTLETSYPGIFTGDSQGFIVNAIALGHRAAGVIDRYLRAESLTEPEKPAPPVVKWTKEETATRMLEKGIEPKPRVRPSMLPLDQRISFQEIVAPFSEQQALEEAERCLQCGVCSECLACVEACGVGAVIHDMVERVDELRVGAVVLAPGYQAYRSELSEEYGWGRYPNVVTSLQFERLLSASGPTRGHVKRPSDGRLPKRIAFLQCVGSRDQSHDYCSAVCCMYAAKEAIMAVEHEPNTEVHVFMMDMRAFSKGYEEYYHRARDKYGIKYTRCRISSVKQNPESHNLIVRYVPSQLSDHETRTARLGIREEEFDMVVLSVGMEMSESVRDLGRELGVALDEYGFCHTAEFDPLQTSRPGIYAVGPFREPKDIPETVIDASGAAALAGELLAPERGTLVARKEYAPERDVLQEEPRIAVFVCHCGSNIGGFLDVPGVAEYTKSLPNVIHAEDNLYTCSQDSIAHITETVEELGANRVVVAACTPLTHGPLFQDSIRAAGLNPYLFEMANIRNQCSWVHSDDRDGATRKAKDLVRMAVARAGRLQPLYTEAVSTEKAVLVIGGGVAGMTAALSLADQGFPVHLVERSESLGGNLRHLHYTLSDVVDRLEDQGSEIRGWRLGESGANGSNPQAMLVDLVTRVEESPLVTVYLNTKLVKAGGSVGNFTSVLQTGVNGPSTVSGQAEVRRFEVEHGATIVATGGEEYRGPEYGYGNDPRILTQQEFEGLLADWSDQQPTGGASYDTQPVRRDTQQPIDRVVMIQCVGPAEQYCSRICCTTALKNALVLKRLKPETEVTIIYRDIRTYGFKEQLYTEARRDGVRFVRYDFDHKPEVVRAQNGDGLSVRVWEPILGTELDLTADLLVLSMPIVPSEGARELGRRLKVSVDMDGFYLEAHVKLRPVDFSSDGVFMAGLAHYPKLLDETIVQAQAAAARAATILSKKTMSVGGVVAQVDSEACVGCLTCVRLCPFGAPQVNVEVTGVGGITGAASINPAQCHGCGICAAECPANAIQLMHFRDEQLDVKVAALMEGAVASHGPASSEAEFRLIPAHPTTSGSGGA